MTATTVDHGVTPRGGAWRYLYGAGWLRALWMAAVFGAFGFGLTVGLRAWGDWQPVLKWTPIVLISILVCAPIGFLAGIGTFDYWARYAIGRPTRPDDHSGHGATSWKDYFKVNTDHKVIGVQYLVTTVIFFIIGGMLALLVRAELAKPGTQYFDPQTYNGLFSVHASLMIFLFVIPAFAGLANFAVPLMLGAADMAFPRLNALSFWLLPIAGVMMLSSFVVPGGAFACGWTGYVPLCSTHQPLGAVFFNQGVQWAGASSIMTALNFLVTIITMRAPGMTFWRMPLLVWANFTTSLLVVIATPFIAGSQFFVMFDRVMHTNFFEAGHGGYVIGYQHIFWFYSHPAVYIMMLPGFGIMSEVISVFSRKPIFGYRLMALSLMAIVVLGFSVWAHHMFVSGMASWLRVPMMVTTLLIAIPTGIKIFSWLATIWEGKLHFNTPFLFALGFLSMFVIGGLSGVMLGAVPIDIHVSDTYFIVAHIHYVLFGGSVFTIFAGMYYWFPKMTGRMYNERLGKLHFWLTFVGFNLTFFPMHLVGMEGMPRRVADYAPKFANLNMFISLASFGLGMSTIVFLYNMITSWRSGPIAPCNPWRAMTLEWQVSSPPPIFNFDEIPQVVGSPYEYGVPGAQHAILAPARAKEVGGGDGPVSDADVARHILVVANETVVSQALVDLIEEKAKSGGPVRVTVLAPVNQPRQGYVVYYDTRRAAARRRLDRTLDMLRAAGMPATGVVVEADPVSALRDAIHQLEPDEIIVSTHPQKQSGWLRRNMVDQMRRVAGSLPFEHVVVDLGAEHGPANVLVVANQTVLGEPLLQKIRERARRRPGELPHHLAAGRLRRLLRGGRAPAPPRRDDAAQRGARRARPDLASRSVRGRDADNRGRARGRDHRLDVPRRALRLAAPRPPRPAAHRHEAAGRARRGRHAGGGDRLMEAHAEQLPHAHDEHHHGPPEPHYSSRIAPRVLGMFLFIGSEIMLFGSFFTAYFFVRVVNGTPWPTPPFHLPVFVAFVNTCILVTSSFTMHWALDVDQARERLGPARRAAAHLPHGTDVPHHAGDRVLAHRLQHGRRRLRDDLLLPHRPARRARLRRPLDPAVHDDPGLPRALLRRAPSRRRDRRDLLALRRRDVDRRVRDGLHPLTNGYGEGLMRNPLRSEAEAFRFLVVVIAGAVIVIVAAAVNRWAGVAAAVVVGGRRHRWLVPWSGPGARVRTPGATHRVLLVRGTGTSGIAGRIGERPRSS